MDTRTDIKEFLASRRARVRPEDAGLPAFSPTRRVPGLRREEVAMLAGISVEYYSRLERGDARGASDSVLEGVVRALKLDDAERTHLFDLVRTANAGRGTRPRPARVRVRPSVQRLLDAMAGVPAFVLDERLDILGANDLGRALYRPLYDFGGDPVNHARFLFLDPASGEFWTDWDKAANDTVSLLRAAAGRDPYDRALSDLVGELSTRSDRFRVRWGSHDVRIHDTGTKHVHHPVVGNLTLSFETLAFAADPGQTVLTYGVEPGSPSAEALALLASWAAAPREDASAAGAGA